MVKCEQRGDYLHLNIRISQTAMEVKMGSKQNMEEVRPIVQLIYNLGSREIEWVGEVVIVEMLRTHDLLLGKKPLMRIMASLHELVEVNWLLERRAEEGCEYRVGLRAINQIGKNNLDNGRAQFVAMQAKTSITSHGQDGSLTDSDWEVSMIGKPILTPADLGFLLAKFILACKIVPSPLGSRQRMTLVTLLEAVKELCRGGEASTQVTSP